MLTGYNNRGVNFNAGAIADPRPTRPAVTYGWVLGTGTNACPRCLQDNGIWPTPWPLLRTAACAPHRLGPAASATGTALITSSPWSADREGDDDERRAAGEQHHARRLHELSAPPGHGEYAHES